jgi:hypothetical protein
MPITLTQSKTAAITTLTSTHTLTFDASVAVGSWVVIVWRAGTANRTPSVPSPGAGTWSGAQDFTAGAVNTLGRVFCWSAQHTVSATATFTITLTGGTGYGTLAGYELAGVDVSGTPRGGSATQSLASSSSWNLIASPGITINSGEFFVGGASDPGSGWGTLTAPSGFTTSISSSSGTGQISVWLGYRSTSGTGVTGAASTTVARATVNGYQVYLPEPAGGSTAKNLLLLGVGA